MEAPRLRVHIVFWTRFMQLREFLEKRFPQKLEITGEPVSIPNAFEVLLPDSGQVLHSKQNGDGAPTPGSVLSTAADV
ncbi:selenoprotein W [Alligator mississippiensis]|uniref:Selenoprotein W n=1 Tax=Alligator mississippiensis TaxID=8496 RepID=A0A151MCJ8_ALLMI|nr:selenoprotein W [Alligator mississippiensis]